MTLGADISKWQGRVHWGRLAETDIRFLLMKATQGTRVDPRFLENWRDCAIRAPKVIRGAYHLIELDDPVEPQVRAFLSAVPGEGWPKGTIPPVLDVETSKIEEVKGNSAEDQEKILEWCSRVERETGVTPILYISPRGLKKLEGHTEGFERYPLWHAQYVEGLSRKAVPTPPPWSNWTFWQFTSKGDGQELGFESKHLDMAMAPPTSRPCSPLPPEARSQQPKVGPLTLGRMRQNS